MAFARPFRPGRGQQQSSLLTEMLMPHRALAGKLVMFSGIVNVMTLTVSLYMMQVYDRVLTSQSKDTLFFLTLACIIGVALSAMLEGVRQQVANRVGTWIAQQLGPRLLTRSLELRLTMPNTRLEALRELATVKNFISTPTVFSVVDMMWVPLYLVVIFLLHPMFGLIGAVGAGTLFGLTFFNERRTRFAIRSNQAQASANMQYAESLVRNSEVIDAMGMAGDTVAHWARGYFEETDAVDETQRRGSRVLAMSKFVRYVIQIVLLATGALLILDLQLTGGAMIAGSIIVARLLAPIEASISYWKQFVLARHAWQKLSEFLTLARPRPSEMELPAPTGALAIQGLTYVPPGMKAAVLRNVSLRITAGEMLAIVGPSASGKTTLSRLLVGVLKPSGGHVRLDGADTFDWKRSDFGPHVGYLPQDIELLPGTIRANIARFRPDATDAEVIAAAKRADCHEMILQLEDGYEFRLGDGALQLSGGQRQRIGLARALFGNPKIIVLDEPNSSLDNRGDAALMETLRVLKQQHVTTAVVSHRPNLLRLADKIVVLQEGRVTNFGPTRDVMAQLAGQPSAKRAPSPPKAPSLANGKSHPVVQSIPAE
jgi:ATP-binding cassette, subfamily C, bacterial exporter for protease/lipase